MRFSVLISMVSIVALPCGLVGCGSVKGLKNLKPKFGKKSDAAEENTTGDATTSAPTQVLGGTIQLVQSPYGFVLIQSSSSPPPPGAELWVHRRGAERPVAELKVSPEQKTGFVVADILSGEPKKGDIVMWNLPDRPPPLGSPLAPPPEIGPAPTSIDPNSLRPVEPIGPAPLTIDPEADLERELRIQGEVPQP